MGRRGGGWWGTGNEDRAGAGGESYGGGTKGPGDRRIDQGPHLGFRKELGPATPAHVSYQPGDLNF